MSRNYYTTGASAYCNSKKLVSGQNFTENAEIIGQGQLKAFRLNVKAKFHLVRTLTAVAVCPTAWAWVTPPCFCLLRSTIDCLSLGVRFHSGWPVCHRAFNLCFGGGSSAYPIICLYYLCSPYWHLNAWVMVSGAGYPGVKRVMAI